MSILISPIFMEASYYCPNLQDNNRTQMLYASDAGIIAANTHLLANSEQNGGGSIKFGTICSTGVNISLQTAGDVIESSWQIYLNNVLQEQQSYLDETVNFTTGIALTPNACGNQILIVGAISAANVTLTAEITFP